MCSRAGSRPGGSRNGRQGSTYCIFIQLTAFAVKTTHQPGYPPAGYAGLRYITAMTKSELIAKLAEHDPQLDAKDAAAVVNELLHAMITSLVKGRRIEIRGFGSFQINYRPPRTGRNPKSGQTVQVPEKFVPHFKAGRELRERVGSK